MNEEPPEELAVVVRKNAGMSVRTRLQKQCDTILADPTGKTTNAKRFASNGEFHIFKCYGFAFIRFAGTKWFGCKIISANNSTVDPIARIGPKCCSNHWSVRWSDLPTRFVWCKGVFSNVGRELFVDSHSENRIDRQRCDLQTRLQPSITKTIRIMIRKFIRFYQ